ncbi:snrna-activating protein complex subunit 4-like [Gigaspora margarita]|uniref:Snrna-activating protein complex subunit 4-like n=1 Tax=Gigaspora margarita TaxID=4874 RepID=A0A8H4A051_GIGMA|nr:snrna-activating protein complex subunit 4-like [Gigaspora margarita]
MASKTKELTEPKGKNKKRCDGCGRPEYAVMCSGPIQGLADSELEKWLKSETNIPFAHFVKKVHEGFAFIHFNSHFDASAFFQTYKGVMDCFIEKKGKFEVRISETFYFGTETKVVYLDFQTPLNKRQRTTVGDDQPVVASSSRNSSFFEISAENNQNVPRNIDPEQNRCISIGSTPVQDVSVNETQFEAPCNIGSKQNRCISISSISKQDDSAPFDIYNNTRNVNETQSKAPYDINSEQGYAPFAIYNDIQNGYINIIVFTPSITSKKDLEIIHSGDYEITIMARLQTIGVLGFVFINNLPNRLEVKVTLPNRIDEDCKAKVTINNGVTLISLKSKNSKRRIMIE